MTTTSAQDQLRTLAEERALEACERCRNRTHCIWCCRPISRLRTYCSICQDDLCTGDERCPERSLKEGT